MDAWIAIDEYDKQFKICDSNEDETEDEKLPRRLEVERIMAANFESGKAERHEIPEELMSRLRAEIAASNFKTTIFDVSRFCTGSLALS